MLSNLKASVATKQAVVSAARRVASERVVLRRLLKSWDWCDFALGSDLSIKLWH